MALHAKQDLMQAVLRCMDELPPEKISEVLNFVLFLRERRRKEEGQRGAVQKPMRLVLCTLPAAHLDHLTGLVAWGGDAMTDSERLYDEHHETRCV